MTTLLTTAAPGQLATLRDRSRHVCVIYVGHPLPPGASPDHGRIGVESIGNEVLLHVDRGVAYTGDDHEVSAWLLSGTRRFPALENIVSWLSDKLSTLPITTPTDGPAAANPSPATSTGPAPNASSAAPVPGARPGVAAPATVTDLARVQVPAAAASEVNHLDLEHELRGDVIGQDVAVATLAAAISRHTGKSHPRRPVTVMLLGPTAVGKTLAAQSVARITAELSGADWQFLRLDMSEFSERFS